MISVTILTKNSEKTLFATLTSVSSFPEVLLFDTGSTDETLRIASSFSNVKIHKECLEGFGKAHNCATELAHYDWILSLDSDEVLSDALIDEIHSLSLKESSVYSIQRNNYFNGKQIKWCGGWYPDRVPRLYNRRETRFNDAEVHEKILLNGLDLIPLKHPMRHTPYLRIDDFLSKMQLYTTLFAKQHTLNKNASVTKALLHAWLAFFKSYFFKRGFLGGKEGLIISLYNSHTTFYKYLKLCEKNNSLMN